MSECDEIDIKELLISLVSPYDYLYSKKSKEFKNVTKRKQKWQEIATKIFTISNKETSGT